MMLRFAKVGEETVPAPAPVINESGPVLLDVKNSESVLSSEVTTGVARIQNIWTIRASTNRQQSSIAQSL